MIQPLRRAHGRLLRLLALLLPLIVALAWRLRPAAPIQLEWPFR